MLEKRQQAALALSPDGTLYHFMPMMQRELLLEQLQGEEGDFMADKVLEYAARISSMPATYQNRGKSDEALIHLHYFYGGVDAWILEKDMGDEIDGAIQHQAFGYVSLNGGGIEDAELGYVSIEALIEEEVELDLYWTPATVQSLKRPKSPQP